MQSLDIDFKLGKMDTTTQISYMLGKVCENLA